LEQEILHIIKGCKAYNATQQEALYKYCYPNMFAVCERYTNNRDDAAALYNEAMMKVLTNINQYDNKGAFMGWVRRIMVNTCIDNCRKQIKYSIRPIEEHYEEQVYVDSYIENKISNEEVILLIQALPKNTGLVFNLYAIEGYKFDEIATALSISIGTVKWHLSEARKSLREKLKHYTNKEIKANASSK
jgi:RNA polymerase sigma-70 factor, ECF subfamily